MKTNFLRRSFIRCFALFTLLLGWRYGAAEIKLPAIFSDNMVLQRDSEVSLWGWSNGGKQIVVVPSWSQQMYYTDVDEEGRWKIKLPTPEAGGPYEIRLSDGQEICLRNILIGEVWVCAGQSNMEMWMMGYVGEVVEGAVDELIHANDYGNMRLLTVERNMSDVPDRECVTSGWQKVSSATLARFSAVAFFFGKTLYSVLHVPIGLICAAKSSSMIQEWMPKEDVDQMKNDNNEGRWKVASRLYNGMISPIEGYTTRGFIWYQGEPNIKDYDVYDDMMIRLVRSWRRKWHNFQMPFYFVQLAPYKYGKHERDLFPLMIEAQYKAAARISYSGIVVTSDLGSVHHIHPGKKKTVGERLAFLALRKDYGVEGLPHAAPLFKQFIKENNKLILSFCHIGLDGRLPKITGHFFSDLYPLQGFEIAGGDRIFYPAKARVAEDRLRIVVWNDSVLNPVAVRYNFVNIPCGNVETVEGQPLAPFRTDNW